MHQINVTHCLKMKQKMEVFSTTCNENYNKVTNGVGQILKKSEICCGEAVPRKFVFPFNSKICANTALKDQENSSPQFL